MGVVSTPNNKGVLSTFCLKIKIYQVTKINRSHYHEKLKIVARIITKIFRKKKFKHINKLFSNSLVLRSLSNFTKFCLSIFIEGNILKLNSVTDFSRTCAHDTSSSATDPELARTRPKAGGARCVSYENLPANGTGVRRNQCREENKFYS